MSLAALIISLGLLVDNGIVVAEELQTRLKRGQDRITAALDTGRGLTTPLLAASLTTIFAFIPLMLAAGGAGEYTRSISIVIAIALLLSWLFARTALILFCIIFLKKGEVISDQVKSKMLPKVVVNLLFWDSSFKYFAQFIGKFATCCTVRRKM